MLCYMLLRNNLMGRNVVQNVILFLESIYSVDILILGEKRKKQEIAS